MRAWRLGVLVGVVVVGVAGLPALGHGDLHERIEALTVRLEQAPQDVELLLRRGDLYRQHAEFEAALRDIDAADRLEGRDADVALLRGRTLLECGCGREADAAGALEGFVGLRPEHGEGWLLLGRARRDCGDHEASIAAYARAIDLMEPPRPEAYLERATEVLETEGAETALAGIDDGIRRLGPIVTLELRAAELELALGRVDAALARIDSVMQQAVRKEAWLARKGRVLEGAGRRAEALEAYRAARVAMETLGARSRRAGRARSLGEQIDRAIERLEGAEERQRTAEGMGGTEARDAGG